MRKEHRKYEHRLHRYPFHKIPAYDADLVTDPVASDAARNSLPSNQQSLASVSPRLKYPPGSWGSVSSGEAWKRHKIGEYLKLGCTNTFEIFRELAFIEKNFWYHPLRLPLNFVDSLQFAQFVTRTHLITATDQDPNVAPPFASSSPQNLVDSDDSKNSEIAEILRLHLESSSALRSSDLYPHLSPSSTAVANQNDVTSSANQQIYNVMDLICGALIGQNRLSADNHAYGQSQFSTFFKRAGYHPEAEMRGEDFEVALPSQEDETVRDASGTARYMIGGEFAWMMKQRSPLQSFKNVSEIPADWSSSVPDYSFHPEMIGGATPHDHHNLNSMPKYIDSQLGLHLRSIPGSWPDSPFNQGDPCEFACAAVLNSLPISALLAQHRLIPQRPHPHDQILHAQLERQFVSEVILAGFSWLSAVAFAQGFNQYNELEYPLSCCVWVSDGLHFRPFYYQLNSLGALWLPPDSGRPVNLVWSPPPPSGCGGLGAKLYNWVDVDGGDTAGNGQRLVVNEALLREICATLCAPAMPAVMENGEERNFAPNFRPVTRLSAAEIELRPAHEDVSTPLAITLSQKDILEGIDRKYDDGATNEKEGWQYEAEPSPRQRTKFIREYDDNTAYKEDTQIERRKKRIKMKLLHKPHPNDIFYYKLVKDDELQRNLYDGLTVATKKRPVLPELYEEYYRKNYVRIKEKRGRYKVIRPPLKWQ